MEESQAEDEMEDDEDEDDVEEDSTAGTLLGSLPLEQQIAFVQLLNNQGEDMLWQAQVPSQEVQRMGHEAIAGMLGGSSFTSLSDALLDLHEMGRKDHELEDAESSLPEHWDWRDVHGENFVSPVRKQAECGACYIFAAAAMLESRVRIATKNKEQPVISVQRTLECSPFGQGCGGGWPFLASKFMAEFGAVPESA